MIAPEIERCRSGNGVIFEAVILGIKGLLMVSIHVLAAVLFLELSKLHEKMAWLIHWNIHERLCVYSAYWKGSAKDH